MPTRFDKMPMPDELLPEPPYRIPVVTTILPLKNPRLLPLARRPRHKPPRERRKKR
jgi:hypothetical protein